MQTVEPGFLRSRFADIVGLIVVKASLSQVREAVADAENVEPAVVGECNNGAFTAIQWLTCDATFAQWLSKKLGTTVAYLWDEDTAGGQGYHIFVNGQEVEVYQDCLNYDEEIAEAAEEMGEEMPELPDRSEGWDVYVFDGEYDYMFRSSLTKVSEDELIEAELIDARFKALEIAVPTEFASKPVDMPMMRAALPGE